MTDPTPLSSATQEVLKAACIHHGLFNEEIVQRRRMIAAVLRAAADLVAPDDYKCFTGTSDWDLGSEARNDAIRDELLAIAAELEGAQ